MTKMDVTVYGAGIFGLSVAFCCARRGAEVQVIDPRGVGAGASGGIVGALAPHTPESWNAKKAFQFDSLIRSKAFWADVADLSGRDPGYARLGRLQPIADDRAYALAIARVRTAEDLWQGHAVWDVVPAADHGDWVPPSASGYLIHDTLSARIHPRRACEALAHAITALGGRIDTEPAERAGSGRVIWATGYEGLLEISGKLERAIGNGVKGQAVLLDCDRRHAPQLFVEALHIVPHGDGTVAIGSTSERMFDDPLATDTQLDDLLGRARLACPALQGAPVLARWAGVRPRARTRAPMLGQHPLRPGEYIANGGFKIGFGVAPAMGEVMADLVLDGQDRIPQGFRVSDNL